jgi:aldehyde:ferredoxin oxidoreductase
METWQGTTLRVNLTTGRISQERVDASVARDFVGGRGVATKILRDEGAATVDPLGPDNTLIFASGTLTGTTAPAAGRYMVVAKSPLTGAVACSNSGGFFGPQMRFAGTDMVVFEGKAESPVYLWLEDGKAELRPADHLWGKNTHETDDAIRAETSDKARVACIGPAGERLVRFACVMNDKHRAAGRSGVGAVMGAKNLKAVAVRGTGKLKTHDEAAFKKAVKVARTKVAESPTTSEGLPTYGTAVLVNVINAYGFYPTRNFRESYFPTADKQSGERMAETILLRNSACFGCPIRCGRITKVETPKRYCGEGEGPEYETVWALGAACGIDDLAAIAKANYICNELGMDTIETGAAVACAMDLAESGYLPESDTGRPLRFGDADAMVEMVAQAGVREGFGDLLAEGGYRLAEKYGHPELFMGAKKQAFPAYDGRGSQGMGLQYATSNRGACHVRGYMIAAEVFGVPMKLEPAETEDKPAFDIAFQNLTAVVDSSGLCLFNTFAFGADEILELLNAATGRGYTMESMLAAGERIWNLERLFNLEAGLTQADDTLPPRILSEPIPEGPMAGNVCQLGEMLPDYYELRGWTSDGEPTEEKLAQLGLTR